MKALDSAIEKGGVKIIFLMRLSPIFPLNLFPYFIALTKCTGRNFVLGSFGLIPKRAMFVYFALSLTNFADVLSGQVHFGEL